jgi:serine/threonine protein kinase
VEHRDLKPENVLICKGVAKIFNFGISSARLTISRTTGFKGTFHYALEYFDATKGYGPMSDIYTFGLVVWAMLAGKRPYDGMTFGQITAQKMQQKLPEIPPTTPAKLAALMNECWNTEARKRPTAADLEPKLADIQRNPGAAVGEKSKSVKDMNTAELVAYLEGEKVLPAFVATVKEHDVTGEEFIGLTQDALVAFPFRLTAFQARIIVKVVDAAKST